MKFKDLKREALARGGALEAIDGRVACRMPQYNKPPTITMASTASKCGVPRHYCRWPSSTTTTTTSRGFLLRRQQTTPSVLTCAAVVVGLLAAMKPALSQSTRQRSPACDSRLVHLCDMSRFASLEACQTCAGRHQGNLQHAGCTNTDIHEFCITAYSDCLAPSNLSGQYMTGTAAMQLPPPKNSTDEGIAAWLRTMHAWRNRCLSQLGYTDGAVGPSSLPGMQWTATSYITVQSHVYDNFMYSYSASQPARKHTVNRFLQDLRIRYGGIDSVLLWPTCKHLTNYMVLLVASGYSVVCSHKHVFRYKHGYRRPKHLGHDQEYAWWPSRCSRPRR
eukprot:COSAG05_NODE_2170_length_3442_cov_3.273706_2_plen_334_part_00